MAELALSNNHTLTPRLSSRFALYALLEDSSDHLFLNL